MLIYLAGGETWGELFLDMGVPFQLYSYYYIRNKLRNKRESGKMLDLLARMKHAVDKTRGRKDCLPYKFMLDSGAFTYHSVFANAHKMNKPCNLPKPDVYFEEYLEFVEVYHEIFDVIVEFDIDDVHEGVTRNDVDIWTNRLLDASLEIAAKTMPVYHGRRGKEWLRDWCLDTRSPLMGVGSEDVDIVVETINAGHRCGKYLHGFGQTQVKSLLLKTQYDSVDSTTWLNTDKFGTTYIFDNSKFITYDLYHKMDRQKHKQYYEKWGLDFKKVCEDDLATMRKSAIIAWRELAMDSYRKWLVRTDGGKYPLLYKLHLEGRVPAVHPLITRAQNERKPTNIPNVG